MTRTIDQMVNQEVIYCVSSLVAELAQNHLEPEECDLMDILTKADWQEPAKEYIWNDMPLKEKIEYLEARGFAASDFEEETTLDAAIIQDLIDEDEFMDFCEAHKIDPHEQEALEHWIVSEWLADRLAAKGEMTVNSFMGLVIWGRTTSGQSITMDGVIQEIYAETHK